ncbi:MAG: hypothetical protein K6G04_04925 [Lachnospiraceae bacterium]|nr:hypothetical protein [Lachnospiraceae bacterium]
MIQAQLIKMKRTPFAWYLFLSTVGLIGMFLLYNVLYNYKPVEERLQLLFEIYGTFLPLLHALTVFFIINPEEQMANMYQLLSVKRRITQFLTLAFMVWSMESIRLLLTFGLVGLQVGMMVCGKQVLLFILGEALLSMLGVTFHLWLNLKFGVALSMFFAILELLQSVMYSNITIVGIWKYLPTAWPMEWKSDVMNQAWGGQLPFWGSCVGLIVIAMALFCAWFCRWEGRKK